MSQAHAQQPVYNVEHLRETLPPYAKDIKLNLGAVLSAEGAPDLTLKQVLGVALAAAYATRDKSVIRAVTTEASASLPEAEATAAKAAATIMAMNNVYYRFMHAVHDEELKKLPPKLRMTIMAGHGIDKTDFELYSLAVSAINGCGMCMAAHAHEVEKAGVSKIGIQSAVRIASVINAAAQSLVE